MTTTVNCSEFALFSAINDSEYWLWTPEKAIYIRQTKWDTYLYDYKTITSFGINLAKTASFDNSVFSTFNLTQTVHVVT